MNGAEYVGQALGQFVARSTWESLPGEVQHETRRAFLNFVGCALGAAADPTVAIASRVMSPAFGTEAATVIGRRERLEPMGAAFANAISANLLDFDDTHWATAIHPTAPVAGAALALAEQRRVAGTDLLQAIALGNEVACRIGLGVSPQHYARGLHITATCGVFGAAAACAKLLGLPAEGVWTAIGIASSESAGVIENLSTSAKNVAVGNAARHGLLAARLAQAGYTAAPAAIEGPFGWARAMGDQPRAEEITHALGQRWEVRRIAYKPYPCGYVFHAVIDAGIQLKERLGPSALEIDSVLVRGNQLLLDRGSRAVATERDARVSIAHAAAIGLLRGRAGVVDFSSAAVADPDLRALRAKVRAELAHELPIGAAIVTVTTRGGRCETAAVRHARGSLENPLSDAELDSKFRQNAEASAVSHSERLRRLWSLGSADELTTLLRLLSEP